MQKHQYEEMLDIFLDLFNLAQRDIDDLNEYIWESICEDQYHFEYKNFDSQEIIESHVVYTKNVVQSILDEIQYFLENEVERIFDEEIRFNILPYEHNGKVQFTIESDHLKSQIGSGMNAYGLFDWSLHSDEEKQILIDDGYLALRELLHYYEACESKPRVRLDKLDLSNFWEYDTTIARIQEEIDEAEKRADQEIH